MSSTKPTDAVTSTGPHLLPVSRGARYTAYALIGIFVVALGFGAWGVWAVRASSSSARPSAAQWRQLQAQNRQLEQRVATLSRSDQISRDANRDLQDALSERDEQISGLRADVAFYERFVGSTDQRRGLAVHALKLQPQADQAWHFTATLTQNLNRGVINRGSLQLSVEGTRDGKLETLNWAQLRQQPNAEGLPFSFKYFQQLEGEVVLPPGFKPLRVTASLQPADASQVDQSFTWSEATANSASDLDDQPSGTG